MVLKRGADEFCNEKSGDFVHNHRFKLRRDVNHLLREHSASLEASIRRVVREEVDQAFQSFLLRQRLPLNHIETSRSRNLQLQFDCNFPGRIFTGNRVEAEGSLPIKVVLLDSIHGGVVRDGPLSSIKIEIVVLPGDFKAEERGDWTESEFNRKVLCEREGKKPLLVGERVVSMSGGVAFITDISFTDNSSWVKSKRFRLGVRVAGSMPDEAGIMEAVSDALDVKDRRGEVYQKHPIPNLHDEVWRLTKIAKDGALCRRCAEKGILSVKDFLQLYYIDPSSLQKLLGVSSRVWKAIVEHATSCSVDDERYEYFSAEDGFGLLLNGVLNVVGVTFDGQNYQPLETCNVYQKFRVEEIRKWLHQNQNKLVQVHSPSISTSLSSETLMKSNVSSLSQQHGDVQEHEQGIQLEVNSGGHPFLYHFGAQCSDLLPDDVVPTEQLIQDEWDTSILNPSGLSLEELGDLFGFQTAAWYPTLGETNNLLMTSASNGSHVGLLSAVPSSGINMSGGQKSKATWSKVRAVVKFKIAASMKNKEFPFCYYLSA